MIFQVKRRFTACLAEILYITLSLCYNLCIMKNGTEILKKLKGVDGALLFAEANTFYVAEYESSNAYIVLTKNKTYYLTDDRYFEEASIALGEKFDVQRIAAEGVFKQITEILHDENVKVLGFEDVSTRYRDYVSMTEKVKGVTFKGIEEDLLKARAVKSDKEVELIKKAASINDLAIVDLWKVIKEGMTEKEVKDEMEYRLHTFGGEGLAFDTIVAFDKNTSKPHAHAGDLRLKCGMPITVDFGCKYKGYCSDITRTFFFGKPSERMEGIYKSVLHSNMAGIEFAKPGVTGADVDKVCREYFGDMAKYFLHGTGHGVGIDIHEDPFINKRGVEPLQKNMIITVEPGLYIPDVGGVRVEDLLVITDSGNEVLSKSDKNLIIL